MVAIHKVMPECSLESVSTHLKRTLRNMAEPLIVSQIYSNVLAAHGAPETLNELFQKLPEQNRWMLAKISFLLYLIKYVSILKCSFVRDESELSPVCRVGL